MAGPWDVVEQAPAAPRPVNRTSPAAQGLAGAASAPPRQPEPRAPLAAAQAGARAMPAAAPAPASDGWDVVSVAPAPPPPREVGFAEGAARTAASSVIPIVRSIDMAAAGLAGLLAPLFGLDPVKEQERIFADAEERSATMRQAYSPQPGEEFGLGGQIAGGVASMPIEVVGGLGLQRGVERAADVVQRGGTLGEAGLAGGVTGAANVAANLLPVKAGGAAGRAVEQGLARVLPGGARTGAVVGGAATGGALGAGADVAVAAAENAALPTGEAFADLERQAEPAVSGGLGAAFGAAAAGAATRGKARPARPAPAAKPAEGTGGSVGAAGTDKATERRERAASLPVPVELTKGQAERSFEQQQFEREQAKDSKTGEPLRRFFNDQNAKVRANLDALADLTGAEQPDTYTAGKRVVEPLAAEAARAKGKVDAEYQRAREAGEMTEEVGTEALVTKLREIEPSKGNAGVIGAAEAELVRLGGATRNADGTLTPGKLSLDSFEELRKTIGKNGGKDATNAHFARELKQTIDLATENAGGDLYKGARRMYADYAAEFKNRKIVADLITLKKGSDERKVAFEDVYRRTIKGGSVDELTKLRDTLRAAGDDGRQAWRELQGQTIGEIRDAALKNTSRNERGDPIVSAAGMDRVIRALDAEGKLDLVFGKKGAETLRDLNDLAKDVYTAPPGSVNFSNTASALRNFVDQLTTYGVSGLPVQAGAVLGSIRKAWQSRAVRKKVAEALPDGKQPLLAKPIKARPFEPDDPPAAAPAPAPKRPPGSAPELPQLPVGEAREIPAGKPASGRAPDLPKLPVPEVAEAELMPIAEAVEVDMAEWAKAHKLSPMELPRAEAVDRALDIDEAAVRAAATQHARSPVAFDRAIERILDASKEPTNANDTAEAARGSARPAPAPRSGGSEEAGRPGDRQGQEGPDAAAQEEVARTAADEAARARAEFDKATEPTGNAITDALSARLRADYDGAVREYAGLKDSQGGTVLNTDVARELSPDYLKDRTRSADVHEPASAFIKRLYAEKLAAPTPAGHERRVLFTAGGTGAGKTTAVAGLVGKGQPAEITYDTNMNGLASGVQKIEQALAAGREVRIAYVYADPLQAFEQAMSRAMNQKGNFGSGRTVPIIEHVRTHVGVSKVIRELVDRYRNDLRVDFKFVDNSRGRGNAAEVALRDLPLVGDNGLREKLEAAAREAHRSGRIDDATLAGFLGESAARPAAAQLEGVGQGVRRRVEPRSDQARQEVAPAPARPALQGATGAATSVVTERGLRVPVRYRLVEAADLTTSHGDDLKPNPAFPAEFQPRDRTRDSSEAQIARIENGIQPELLADGPKASDGAPIVGPDGLVESGNARTIALRRAYRSGKAEGYREFLAANAERFGLTAEQVRAAKQPVLVRERTADVDRADFARQANEAAVSAMSEAEQAQADAKQLPDLEELVTNDDGTVNIFRSTDFIRQFMQTVASPNERGQLMTADGRLSQRGVQRIRNAVFAKAYGDTDLVASMAEATDGNVRNVMAGLLRASPIVAKVRELSEAGARGDVAFVPDLVEAVRRFSELREAGQKVDEYLSQGSLIGGEASPRVADLLRQLELDSRAPRRIAEMVEDMARRIDAEGDPRQASLLGETDEKD